MKLCDLFENYRDSTREKYSGLRSTEYDSRGRPKLNSKAIRIDPTTGVATNISRSSIARLKNTTPKSAKDLEPGDPQIEFHEEQLKAIDRSVSNAFDTLKLDIMVGINREKAKQAMHGLRPGELASEFTVEMNKAYDSQMRKIRSDHHSNEIYNYVHSTWNQAGRPIGEFVKEYRERSGVGRWGGGGYYHWTFKDFQKFKEARRQEIYDHFRFKYLKDYYRTQDEISDNNDTSYDASANAVVRKIPGFNIPKMFNDKRNLILDIWNDYKNHNITDEQAFSELSTLGMSNNMITLLLSSEEKS